MVVAMKKYQNMSSNCLVFRRSAMGFIRVSFVSRAQEQLLQYNSRFKQLDLDCTGTVLL